APGAARRDRGTLREYRPGRRGCRHGLPGLHLAPPAAPPVVLGLHHLSRPAERGPAPVAGAARANPPAGRRGGQPGWAIDRPRDRRALLLVRGPRGHDRAPVPLPRGWREWRLAAARRHRAGGWGAATGLHPDPPTRTLR